MPGLCLIPDALNFKSTFSESFLSPNPSMIHHHILLFWNRKASRVTRYLLKVFAQDLPKSMLVWWIQCTQWVLAYIILVLVLAQDHWFWCLHKTYSVVHHGYLSFLLFQYPAWYTHARNSYLPSWLDSLHVQVQIRILGLEAGRVQVNDTWNQYAYWVE